MVQWEDDNLFKKVEATMSTIMGLLNANCISEVRYIELLSNVVLVKKSFGE